MGSVIHYENLDQDFHHYEKQANENPDAERRMNEAELQSIRRSRRRESEAIKRNRNPLVWMLSAVSTGIVALVILGVRDFNTWDHEKSRLPTVSRIALSESGQQSGPGKSKAGRTPMVKKPVVTDSGPVARNNPRNGSMLKPQTPALVLLKVSRDTHGDAQNSTVADIRARNTGLKEKAGQKQKNINIGLVQTRLSAIEKALGTINDVNQQPITVMKKRLSSQERRIRELERELLAINRKVGTGAQYSQAGRKKPQYVRVSNDDRKKRAPVIIRQVDQSLPFKVIAVDYAGDRLSLGVLKKGRVEHVQTGQSFSGWKLIGLKGNHAVFRRGSRVVKSRLD